MLNRGMDLPASIIKNFNDRFGNPAVPYATKNELSPEAATPLAPYLLFPLFVELSCITPVV